MDFACSHVVCNWRPSGAGEFILYTYMVIILFKIFSASSLQSCTASFLDESLFNINGSAFNPDH